MHTYDWTTTGMVGSPTGKWTLAQRVVDAEARVTELERREAIIMPVIERMAGNRKLMQVAQPARELLNRLK